MNPLIPDSRFHKLKMDFFVIFVGRFEGKKRAGG